MPARTEHNLLWLNRGAIGASATEDFTAASLYWSSTESSASATWGYVYSDGDHGPYTKTGNFGVRCVRRDSGGGAPDITPNTFNFTDQTDVAVSTLIESNIPRIVGIDTAASVSITGDGSPEYRICSDGTSDANCDGSEVQTWTSGAAIINNNQYLQLRRCGWTAITNQLNCGCKIL